MIIILMILFIIVLCSLRFHFKGIDKQYLSKEYTQPIKGIFIVIVFLSHIRQYHEYTHYTDLITIDFLNYLGQLMVALFLFYSGYGVYEAIKKKGKPYIDSLMKNRLGKTFFDFAFAVTLYLIVNICLGKFYSLTRILLSYIGWMAIGNSAWYMFAIFSLYIFTYFCFKISKDNRIMALCLMTICSLVYVYVFSIIKENWWSSTYLCYIAGMWYSYFKTKIDEVLNKYNILYYITTLVIIASYLYFYNMRYQRLLMFNLVSILFCLIFVFLSMKISLKSKILTWFGDYLFWVYILQRIPMMIFQYLGMNESQPYIFLILSFIITVIISYYINIATNKLKDKIWGRID